MLLALLLTVAIHSLVGAFGQTGAPGMSLGRPLRRSRRSEIDGVTPPLRPKPVRESVRLGMGYHSQMPNLPRPGHLERRDGIRGVGVTERIGMATYIHTHFGCI